MKTRPESLRDLPPMTGEMCTVHLLRENGYVTLVMRKQNGENAGVFTLHAVEAEKLGGKALEVAQGSDGSTSLVEGVHVGGPPRADQLIGSS